jgi:hypothetical protein
MSKNKPAEKAKVEAPLPEPKKATMTVRDRLLAPQIFPQKSNIVGQVIARDIAKKLEISKEEAEQIELKPFPDGRYKWNGEKAKVKEIELTGPEIAFLKAQVARIDETEQVTFDILELCETIQRL